MTYLTHTQTELRNKHLELDRLTHGLYHTERGSQWGYTVRIYHVHIPDAPNEWWLVETDNRTQITYIKPICNY